jgi:hypothetical protein
MTHILNHLFYAQEIAKGVNNHVNFYCNDKTSVITVTVDRAPTQRMKRRQNKASLCNHQVGRNNSRVRERIIMFLR